LSLAFADRHKTGENGLIKGIGVDSTELSRIARVYGEYGEKFLNRIYSEDEQAYSLRYRDPVPRLAARFAAKEACMKALGTGWNDGVRWRDIVIENTVMGKPEMKLFGRARWYLERLGAQAVHVSITHSRQAATVIVIFE
jgi:holo-[acyl-carrier protein] synthase